MSQDKAQFAVNGQNIIWAIRKDSNVVLAHLVASLRAQ